MLAIIIVLIIVLVVAFAKLGDRYGQYNTESIAACPGCDAYPVHMEHEDREAAAALIDQIVRRCNRLTHHLKATYEPDPQTATPDMSGRIDIVPIIADPALNETNAALPADAAVTSEEIRERVRQLLQNFNPRDIREISPLNSEGLTSYTENKTSLVLCLRRKTPDASGNYPLHDINTMMFVTIHEMTHMMNDTWGHPMDFWELFRFMLVNAQECGVYKPVNYATSPMMYCGLRIDHNPYFAKFNR